ncbi:transcriptional regulator swi6 [Clydaea vesicula]|uniref:Transcriptional regulator swi6 n=1 Tax=Clydaea vesicula TaxID=447962 RepID=A0AAD5U7F1_9FUNG|nr:transcriptional regulator swi6 [Clydaea vesicula]
MINLLLSINTKGVSLWQTEINNIEVMRRIKDGWMNATQILKVAGLSKNQRTIIITKEVFLGSHQIVQGGYGKYQGTWVSLDIAKNLAIKFNVQHLLEPIFSIPGIISDENHYSDDKGKTDDENLPLVHIPTPHMSPLQSTEHKIDNMDAISQEASKKQKEEKKLLKLKKQQEKSLEKKLERKEKKLEKQQEKQKVANYFPTPKFQNSLFSNADSPPNIINLKQNKFNVISPPNFSFNTQQNFSDSNKIYKINTLKYLSDNSLLDSKCCKMQQPYSQLDAFISTDLKRELLSTLYLNKSFHKLYWFLPEHLNLVIDEDENTVLHWASALGRIDFLNFHIAKIRKNNNVKNKPIQTVENSVLIKVNKFGKSPISFSVNKCFTFDSQNFDKLLKLFEKDLFKLKNFKNQTFLHEIVLTSAGYQNINSENGPRNCNEKFLLSRYYLNCFFEWAKYQVEGYNDDLENFYKEKNNSIISNAEEPALKEAESREFNTEFFSEKEIIDFINTQDVNGDTALSLAVKLSNYKGDIKLVEILLNLNSDVDLKDIDGQTPYFLMKRNIKFLDFVSKIKVKKSGKVNNSREIIQNSIITATEEERPFNLKFYKDYIETESNVNKKAQNLSYLKNVKYLNETLAFSDRQFNLIKNQLNAEKMENVKLKKENEFCVNLQEKVNELEKKILSVKTFKAGFDSENLNDNNFTGKRKRNEEEEIFKLENNNCKYEKLFKKILKLNENDFVEEAIDPLLKYSEN